MKGVIERPLDNEVAQMKNEFAPISLASSAALFGIGIQAINNVPGDSFDGTLANGIYKGQNVMGRPEKFGEWVFILNLNYDAQYKYGVQLCLPMNESMIAHRYKRDGTWNAWKYAALTD